MNLDLEVQNFALEMQKQINFNAKVKSDWREWKNVKEILVDLEYHKAKMMIALKERNMGAMREYIADCANILMFLGAAFEFYKEFSDDDLTYEMYTDVFREINSSEMILKNGISNL